MAKKETKTNINFKDIPKEATGYKLRMVFGKWYVQFFKTIDPKDLISQFGPYNFAVANTIANRCGLPNLEAGVTGDRP